MESVILILWPVEKDGSFAVEGDFSISEKLCFGLDLLCLVELLLVDETSKMDFPDVAKQ